MKVHQFLDRYGVTENPFSQEDAQSDQVFQQHCLEGTRHPAWDKIYGSPEAPATSVVFGEQGSGKTALRLQMASALQKYNSEHPDQQAYIVVYDDFNPFLDAFRERLSGRKRRPEKALQHWQLWDHMDALLTLATTRLANAIRGDKQIGSSVPLTIDSARLSSLTPHEKRDVLLLAALYDHNRDYSPIERWNALRRKLRFSNWMTWWDVGLGSLVSILTLVLTISIGGWSYLLEWWFWLIVVLGWLPLAWHQLRLTWWSWRIGRQVRVIEHQVNPLRRTLSGLTRTDLLGQPLPTKARGDDRYELIRKLQAVLKSLGFASIVVLMDRVDEPHLVNGNAERIRDLLWPMFDNKFLKHPGIAFKLLLPSSVAGFLGSQEKEFYERSRLDKQNLVRSLNWTGQGLYDVANDRVKACAKLASSPPGLQDFFDQRITRNELISTFDRLRAPRHLFKFLYRLLVDHCSKYTEDEPQWKIQPETLHATLAVFQRELEMYDQKQGTG